MLFHVVHWLLGRTFSWATWLLWVNFFNWLQDSEVNKRISGGHYLTRHSLTLYYGLHKGIDWTVLWLSAHWVDIYTSLDAYIPFADGAFVYKILEINNFHSNFPFRWIAFSPRQGSWLLLDSYATALWAITTYTILRHSILSNYLNLNSQLIASKVPACRTTMPSCEKNSDQVIQWETSMVLNLQLPMSPTGQTCTSLPC